MTHRRFLHSIDAGEPFAETLARGLLARYGDDPMKLGRVTLLVPTRRSVRAVTEAFLRVADGGALILPKMMPLGDLDEDPPGLGDSGDSPGAGDVAEWATVGGARRRLLLTRLILARADAPSAAEACQLAEALGSLLDQIQTERLDARALDRIVPDHLAHHWQQTLDYLKLITEHWPAILAEEGAIDAAEARDRHLTGRARRWAEIPPPGPVIAAGSTGSIPATADLLETISALPRGAVVLPGLDRDLTEEAWAQVDDSHPQASMKRLLDRLGAGRGDVGDWHEFAGLETPAAPPRSARRRMLAEALKPAASTTSWRLSLDLPPEAGEGLHRIVLPTSEDEARCIAVVLRSVAEQSGRTATLITADRELARRVSATLARWGITVDDSAGRPLSQTSVGSWLAAVADLAREDAAPLALLSCLKHPFAAAGVDRAECRRRTRHLERLILRGPRPDQPGFVGLMASLDSLDAKAAETLPGGVEEITTLKGWLGDLAERLEPLSGLFDARRGDRVGLTDLVHALITASEALAQSPDISGPARLWVGEAGERAALALSETLEACGDFPALPPGEGIDLLFTLIGTSVVRPRFPAHPRLAILGPLEARLQQADVVILGGLNEGSWPPDPGTDPWMSRPMRAEFGLPGMERRIGLSAHDFVQATMAPTAILTRAERSGGSPTVPARWLTRLDTILEATGVTLDPGPWETYARHLDAPEGYAPIGRPAALPPIEARPTGLSVTRIGLWMRDPYALYAMKILKLDALDPIDMEPTLADLGTLVHDVLKAFIDAHRDHMPADAHDRLLAEARAEFDKRALPDSVRTFWWARFSAAAVSFIEAERWRRDAGCRPIKTEQRGEWDIDLGGGHVFKLSAIADRIDAGPGGSLHIIDYKTGTTPSAREVRAGFEPQLPLEAAMVARGAFPTVSPGEAGDLLYWSFKAGAQPKSVVGKSDSAATMADDALAGVTRLAQRFLDPNTAYIARPSPRHMPRYNDYDLLERAAEWSSSSEGNGE